MKSCSVLCCQGWLCGNPEAEECWCGSQDRDCWLQEEKHPCSARLSRQHHTQGRLHPDPADTFFPNSVQWVSDQRAEGRGVWVLVWFQHGKGGQALELPREVGSAQPWRCPWKGWMWLSVLLAGDKVRIRHGWMVSKVFSNLNNAVILWKCLGRKKTTLC